MTINLIVAGVSADRLSKIEAAGYTTAEKVARASIEDLKEIDGIGAKSALRLIGAAQTQTGIGAPKSSLLIMEQADKGKRFITTGSEALDELLGGGIRTGITHEIAGANGAGKSQLAAQIAVNAVIPTEMGGLNGKTLWIDTEHTGEILTYRFKDMLVGHNLDYKVYMPKIEIVSAPNTEIQMNRLRQILQEGNHYDCIIIDGLMTKFRAEYLGRGNLSERQQLLADHTDDLNVYATEHAAAVLFTNQVMDRPDMMYGDPTTPIGGNIVGHSSKIRLYIKKSKANTRIVRISKSPNLPEGEAIVALTSEGICDAKRGAT